MEVQVKKAHLSPVTSFLVSLSLVVGILVADLTNHSVFTEAHAQVIAGSAIQVATPDATLSGDVITAQGLFINGVATDGVFLRSVRISNSFVRTGCGINALGGGSVLDSMNLLGAYPSGDPIDPTTGPSGAYPSGEVTGPTGAYPSGVTYSGSGLQVIGGVLEGSDIHVTNGVISGSNLRVVGAYVTSTCAL
ncbi:MAG: hypothetical protein QOC99_485 [Acidobacteriota bacterium]|nr:hypothetical protein [Acidobacteriota bacterium]MDT7777973.1 hypothetical protein [Acidobacteriota bacterium]